MHMTSTMLTALGAALFASGVFGAEAPYYNPANAASSTGKTIGYELYKTVGCPGRGILEIPCKDPLPAIPVVVKPADSDGDGVTDDGDRCPGTPKGAKVDSKGCELDGDKDAVVDRLDKCPTTPPGRTVNAQGCELDGDGDGVVDALDKCPTTPQAAPSTRKAANSTAMAMVSWTPSTSARPPAGPHRQRARL
ncbi:MAG: thrombospondin type 3 repeat-containing protein [Hydrogenophilales bacterium]|nr:thrombospondin type 3 repeat-containing protein [Hydrogenophilales bacterium]